MERSIKIVLIDPSFCRSYVYPRVNPYLRGVGLLLRLYDHAAIPISVGFHLKGTASDVIDEVANNILTPFTECQVCSEIRCRNIMISIEDHLIPFHEYIKSRACA